MTTLDLKYAWRLLIKRPQFTLVTIIVLTGGLAISLYTFAALYTLRYRDLPLPDGGSVVRIGTGDWPNLEPLDAFELAALRSEAEGVREVGVYRPSLALVGEPGSSRSLPSIEADWRIFEFSRTTPLLGRGFVEGDTRADAQPVTVVSYETWQSVFAGDPGVVNRLVRINDRPTQVVGVMREGYGFPLNAQLWLPLSQQELEPPTFAGISLNAYARLSPGVSATAAEAELTALVEGVRAEHPNPETRPTTAVSVMSFQEEMGGILGTVLFSISNLLALSILLMAAINVSHLLLARTNERIREAGVRVSVGAPRWQLIAQVLLENTLLCAVSGALAVTLVARALTATDGFMRAWLNADRPFWWTWSMDGGVITWACVLFLLTMLGVSVLPALWVNKVDPNILLRDATRTHGLRMSRVSRGLVTDQIALISAVMLVGSAAAVIAARATSFEFGMDTDGLFLAEVEPPAARYPSAAERLAFYGRVLDELRVTNGVEAAMVMQPTEGARFAAEGIEYASPDDHPFATLMILSETPTPVGPALLEGRAFDGRDGPTDEPTAIVSASLARSYWLNESALGRRILVRSAEGSEERTVVGVVADVRYDPLGMTATGLAAIYVPLPQTPGASARFVVSHPGDEMRALASIYEALARVDPSVPPGNVRAYTAHLERLSLFATTLTKLLAGCGLFAILLAMTGIFGMSSNAVALRRHEVGIRRALGADDAEVLSFFMAGGIRQLGRGFAVSGVLCAIVLIVIRQGFAVGAGTLTLIAATVGFLVSGSVLLAIYLATRGVVRLEPGLALRSSQ
jgi:predicted permease